MVELFSQEGETRDVIGKPPDKALRRMRLRASWFHWRSVRATELGRYVPVIASLNN